MAKKLPWLNDFTTNDLVINWEDDNLGTEVGLVIDRVKFDQTVADLAVKAGAECRVAPNDEDRRPQLAIFDALMENRKRAPNRAWPHPKSQTLILHPDRPGRSAVTLGGVDGLRNWFRKLEVDILFLIRHFHLRAQF